MSRLSFITSRRVRAALLAGALAVGGLALYTDSAGAADGDGPATKLLLSGVDTEVSENAPDTITVTAQDDAGDVKGPDNDFVKTVTFSATGANPACADCFTIEPHDAGAGNERKYTFLDSDNGVKNFTLTWTGVGAVGNDREFKVAASLDETPATETVDVVSAKATKVVFDSAGEGAVDKTPFIGQPDKVTVTLRNSLDDIDKAYAGEVHFENSTCLSDFRISPHEGQDIMNKHYVFKDADDGVKIFDVTWLDEAPAGPGCKLNVTANILPAGQVSAEETGIQPELPIGQPTTTTTTTPGPTTTTTAPPNSPPPHVPVVVTGALAGGSPHVRVARADGETDIRNFWAYDPAFKGGVAVAMGDVNDDGWKDIVTSAGPGGGPHVKVFSGKDNSLLASFYAYQPGLSSGVNVAVADVNNDGKADIITGPNAQPGWGPHVKVFSGILNAVQHDGNGGYPTPSLLQSFFAYNPAFTGGIRVAATDLDNDNKADIITGAGPGGGPHVKSFKSNANGGEPGVYTELGAAGINKYAFEEGFTGGVFVAVSEGKDGKIRAIVGSGPGRSTEVRTLLTPEGETGPALTISGTQGAAVAIGQLDSDDADEFVAANASSSSTVRRYNFPQSIIGSAAEAFGGFPNGVSIAIGVI